VSEIPYYDYDANVVDDGNDGCDGVRNGKALPVTGYEGQEYCECSMLPHFLDNHFTDGDKVVSVYSGSSSLRVHVSSFRGAKKLS
jgi:hypothetical protein